MTIPVALQLGQMAMIGLTTLYTVPSHTTTILKSFDICNTTSIYIKVRVYLVPSGGSVGTGNALLYDFVIKPHFTLSWEGEQVLTEGSLIRIQANVGGATITASGVEIPNGYGDELVWNPGFETISGGSDVFLYWSNPGQNGGVITRDTSVKRSGAASCKCAKTTAWGSYAEVYQDNGGGVGLAGLTALTDYLLTFWTKGDGSHDGAYGIYDLIAGGYSSPPPSGVVIIAPTHTLITGDWSLVSVPFTTPASCTSILISFSTFYVADVGDAAYVYFDDVSVREAL